MDSHKILGFVGILKKSFNILLKNGKLMASVTILTLLLHSFLFMSNILSTKTLVTDFLIKLISLLVTSNNMLEFSKTITGIREDVRILLIVHFIFLLAHLMVLLFSIPAIIIASSIAYCSTSLSNKDFLLKSVRSCIKPFVTWFYITLFGVGYTSLVLAILIPVVLIVPGHGPRLSLVASIMVLIPATIFYTYLAVVWTLSLVISAIEEGCYGIEALGKAAILVKGMEIHGFALNLVFTLVSFAIQFLCLKLISVNQSVAVQIIIGLLVINFIYLVKMFELMAYTVFYYQCKKTHGEEIELQGSIKYRKLPTTPFVSEDLP